ncbi:MAG: hypothetical protein ACOX5F_04325 [Anaerovoracaceae bacterium]|jgi:hypothetical protein
MIKNTYLVTNTRKGFITVEAGIFLPIFIIGILTIAYLIKLMVVQGGVFHSYTDEARLLAAEAYIDKVTPIILFEPKLQNRLYNENLSDIEDICLENFNYLYKDDRDSGLISMDLSYKVKLKLPIQFYKDFPITETLVFRGFVGADEELDPMTFEEMESNEASHLVYVFPRAGGRYHNESCTFLYAEPLEMILSGSVRRRYDPCSLCKPGDLSNGNLIYCFNRAGEVFHRGSCYVVDRYVISIEKEDAINKGYTTCLKCGG